ncbi:MAG: type II toxin-antitoxin system HicA family toxin [Dehalococcoidia bacterium]
MIPLCSSNDVINALQRAGFTPARSASCSHQFMVRELMDGTKRTATVVLGKKEIPRFTLRGILRQANMTEDEFRELLR